MAEQIAAQKRSNRDALPYFDAFAGHREHLTALVVNGASADARLRLCVLGAGNCHDLDLSRLSELYDEIHLVDVDESALERARDRQDAATRSKIVCYAPVDLSGLADRLDRWAVMQVESDELVRHPSNTCNQIASCLPGPFDVVISTCVLTQLQWAALNVLSDTHQLFGAIREILTLTHLRTLAALTAPGGHAILATDLVSNLTYPLEQLAKDREPKDLVQDVLESGGAIHVANPHRLSWIARTDPMLRHTVRVSDPVDAWLWHNGPERVFLVYALELQRQPFERQRA
jgi:hypothetical protein